MIIRPITNADFPFIVTLVQQSIKEVAAAHYSPQQVQVWADRFSEQTLRERLNGQITLVAENGHELTGIASLGFNGVMDLLFVHKDYQRQGVASVLYQRLEAKARASELPAISAAVSLSARPFFEAQGFKVDKQQTVEINETTFTNYSMSKRLVTTSSFSSKVA